ncbi:MAG: helix-turn-helix transcriptional regulator [Methylococcales bacterium]
MLPQRTDKNFPSALKLARESKGLTYTQLAKLLDISPVMPSRYENEAHSSFCTPRQDTWEKLNTVLFSEVQTNSNLVKEHDERIYLDEASVEEIIHELKSRGITNVNISF